jgi:diaminohydroxyphosphoribosylaminopyrimidine deaminase / 5-amino-6-(5-phosphoribosylamino)uracil reductase
LSPHLGEALLLAQQRRGFCAPNPAVGAVVVKEGVVIASGTHWAAGQPHAEVAALNNLSSEQAAGSTVYVTLEPCCHFGRTPPCVDLLIQRKVKEVIYSYRDPNPLVAGKSEHALKAAGIKCSYLPLAEIDAFYRSYHYWTLHRRPWVTAKIALSLDGKIAGKNGQRVAITGPELQVVTHQWRKRSDAILTTAKTIIHDDPQLNIRLAEETLAKPIYVLDRNLVISSRAQIFTSSPKVTLFYQQGLENTSRLAALEAHGAHCIALAFKQNRLDLEAVLHHIGQDGVHDLWVEAGGTCFQALILENLVQRALLYVAPKVLGPIAQTGFTQAFDFSQAKHIDWRQVGQDMLCEVDFSGNISP